MKYRKKPVVIEAFQYDGGLKDSDGNYYVPEWAVKAFEDGVIHFGSLKFDEHLCELFIDTLEGTHHASVGDYIIRGVNGELYPCKPDIFNMTYEAVEEEGEKCDTECIYNCGNECPAASGCAGHEEDKEYCCNCRWYDIDAGVCCNASSDYCADFRNLDDSCEEWEER